MCCKVKILILLIIICSKIDFCKAQIYFEEDWERSMRLEYWSDFLKPNLGKYKMITSLFKSGENKGNNINRCYNKNGYLIRKDSVKIVSGKSFLYKSLFSYSTSARTIKSITYIYQDKYLIDSLSQSWKFDERFRLKEKETKNRKYTFQFDSANNCIYTELKESNGNTHVRQFLLRYDSSGNLVHHSSLVEGKQVGITNIKYDNFKRLVGWENDLVKVNKQYDHSERLVEETTTEKATFEGPHELLTEWKIAFNYGRKGTLKSKRLYRREEGGEWIYIASSTIKYNCRGDVRKIIHFSHAVQKWKYKHRKLFN